MAGPFVIEDPAPFDPLLASGGFDRLSSGVGSDMLYELGQGPMGAMLRQSAQQAANTGPVIGGGRGGVQRGEPASSLLDPADANERYGIDGELTWSEPIREDEAKLLRGWKLEELQRQDVLRRADRSLLAGTARFGSTFVAQALDPINVASAFIPVVGEARFAAMAARVGMTGARALRGAGEGLVGAAVVEPLILGQASRQQADYDAYDSLLNLTLGTALGGGLHVGLGWAADRLAPDRTSVHAAGDTILEQSSPAWREVNPFRSTYRDRLMGTAAIVDDMPADRRHALLQGAVAALAEGRPIDVGELIAAERSALGRAYDQVLAVPQGLAGDPLVMISPSDIDAVAVSRGGWKGLGDAEIRGAGYGLVKFIWRHGEQSGKAVADQVARDDILAFPHVIRRPETLLYRSADGKRREWLVERPDGQAVLYADKVFDGGRHLVTVHVIGKDRLAAKLAERNVDVGEAGSPGRDFQVPARDTAAGPYDRRGAEPATRNIGRTVALRKDGTPAIYRDRKAAERWVAELQARGEPVRLEDLPSVEGGAGRIAIVRESLAAPVLDGFTSKRAAEKAMKRYQDPQGRPLAIVPDHSQAGPRRWVVVAGHSDADVAAMTAAPDLARFAERAEDFEVRVNDGRARSRKVEAQEEFQRALGDIVRRGREIRLDPEDAAGVAEIARRTGGGTAGGKNPAAKNPNGRVDAVAGSLAELEADLGALDLALKGQRDLGRVQPEDDADLAAADELVAYADAKGAAREVAAHCLIGAR